MSKLGKGDIALDFYPNITFEEKTEVYQKRVGSWGKPKYQTTTRTILEYQGNEGKLDECCFDIASLMKDYMINYAPIDKSKHKDKIVLRDNIRVEQKGLGRYIVGPQGIVYALRRNFENNLHPNKKHYMEKTWNNHRDEYQAILNSYAQEIGADILKKAIIGKSGGEKEYWGQGKKLANNGKFSYRTKL